MKINFSQVLKDFSGEEIKEAGGEGEEDKLLTLGLVCVNSLLVAAPGDITSGTTKMKRFNLAQRLHEKGEVEVSASEIVMLKDMIAKGYSTLIVGLTWNMIEPKE